jgi:hypothetical protein
MLSEENGVCDVWETSSVDLPFHSRLYHLDPMGPGTPLVESLTSYVTRLADQHDVSPFHLTSRLILPELLGPRLSLFPYNHLKKLWAQSNLLNGRQTRAEDWVQALGKLTQRTDLQFLTLLTWRMALPSMHLLRTTAAWCSQCYQQWHDTSHIVYQPLLWQIQALVCCPEHDTLLQERCPYPDCARPQFHLAPRSRLGYCIWCSRWLGKKEPAPAVSLSDEEREWQRWVGKTMGELLGAAPSIGSLPDREQVCAKIATYLQALTGGDGRTCAKLLHVDKSALWGWKQGRYLPLLNTQLRICFSAGVSLLQLLVETEERQITLPTPISYERRPAAVRKAYRKWNLASLQQALEAELQSTEEPPCSMRQVAQRLHYDHSRLIEKFPHQCHMISAKYKEYQERKARERLQTACQKVQQATLLLHSQGIYPSESQIRKLPGIGAIFKQKEVREMWQEMLRELGWR